mmetsp:Transcript_17124/g.24043  ORF Transcript_17124/g.24043 Transcript_17124/m.24043 type:complete len:125 (-) Transcript_17124:191-565(-)|eukprot:CAMPEP_0175094664 /NCGR_PEP_ID=MMETSP0086_2-20121207/3718_1 /TAXON_ID=136419 /ORGANISM="Unknown Unknown, Strain D1" /LENGTH=124 /DNA_ID=CAMNT_0016367811 /DNA_START=25 /DNA_END=399 /DNA_ORIENTATION=+
MAEEKKAQELIERLADEITSLLAQGNKLGAIQACLQEVPATKKEDLKTKHASTVGKALTSVSSSEIKKMIDDLNQDEMNNAMKYVYKAMGVGDSPCATLLSWHAALQEKCGVGIIARAMCDRKV